MIQRWLGIDGVDFLIQAGITMCIAVVLSSINRQHEDMMIGAVFAGSLGVLAWRRHWARKRGALGSPAAPSGEYNLDLEHRVADLEAAQQRIYELEERVDFAERLLAQGRPDRIEEPR